MSLTKEDLQAIGELMDNKLEPINIRLGRMENDISQIKEDVADIKSELKFVWEDIDSNEKRIGQHEYEFHGTKPA